jgi:hypothetical protein
VASLVRENFQTELFRDLDHERLRVFADGHRSRLSCVARQERNLCRKAANKNSQAPSGRSLRMAASLNLPSFHIYKDVAPLGLLPGARVCDPQHLRMCWWGERPREPARQ